MTSSAWLPILLALPVLLLGESLVRHIRFLSKFSIPAPVVGGLLISLIVLALNASGASAMQLANKVATPWWTWLVSTETEWAASPPPSVALSLPLQVGFFTCIGLNATWDILRRGSVPLLIFVAVTALLEVVQNGVGVGTARAIGAHPLLGLVCGSITMVGGLSTAFSFTPTLERGGLAGAGVMGAAAATVGLVVGGLMSGPVGAWLIRRHHLKPEAMTEEEAEASPAGAGGILPDLHAVWRWGRSALVHLLMVVICMKAGTWLSFFLQKTGVTFPVHIGAMTVGVLIRNAFDFSGWRWLRSDVISGLGSVMLALFLTLAMMGLNLLELTHVAVPMLCVVAVQVVVMVLFAVLVCWRIMGRNYEAAVMSAGLCGFGIGNTANAVASMKSLVEAHGPAPRAFLVVPLVGTLLGDLTNAVIVTMFINLVK